MPQNRAGLGFLRGWGENPQNLDWFRRWVTPGMRVAASEGHGVTGVQEVVIWAESDLKPTLEDIDELNLAIEGVELLATRAAGGNFRMQYLDAALVSR